MESEALLAQFDGQLDEFERFQGYVDRARALSSRFREEVVKRVVAEYNEAKMGVVGVIMVAQADVESALTDLDARKAHIEEAVASSRLGLEELELRLAIGDLDQRSFNRESVTFKAEVERAERELAAVQVEARALGAALQRWERIGMAAGVLKAA